MHLFISSRRVIDSTDHVRKEVLKIIYDLKIKKINSISSFGVPI